MNNKNVLFLVNESKDEKLVISKEIIDFLEEKHCSIYLEEYLCDQFPNALIFDSESKIDFALVLGGDGTLLNKLHKYSNYDFPYFGVNLGRVGCLTEATISNYKDKIQCILDGKFSTENRSTIEYVVKVNEDETYTGISFNEVSVERGKLFKMLLINVYVNSSNKTSFYADGVIVATATGSSAYSLSSGGPLLLPTAKNYVITPLCPQLRTITSLVVNDTDVISIDINDTCFRQSYEENKPIVVIDGKTMIEINENSEITIRKSKKYLRLIKVNTEGSLFEPTFKVAMSNKNLFSD